MGVAQDIVSRYRDIKTLPHVVTKLSKLINDSNTTMKDFEDVIKMDPTLVVRLLRLVNSPYYGLSRHVESIGRAVAFIGMKNLYNIAVTDALKHMFSESKHSHSFSRKNLWLHCAAVSTGAKMLAERIFGINSDDAYLCGILHDFGLIAEDQVLGDAFLQVCNTCGPEDSLPDLERAAFGTDHCEIGYLMAQGWDMPEDIQAAIRDHHKMNLEVAPGSLTGIIQIAEYITGQLGYKVLKSNAVKLPPSLLRHIRENSYEYEVLIEDLPEEMSKARDVYGAAED